jgi:hypothetical protein
VPNLSLHFEKILSRAHGNFEEQNKVLESSKNYYFFIIIIINNKYYNYIFKALYNYCISKNVLLEVGDEEENLEITGAAIICCLKRRM